MSDNQQVSDGHVDEIQSPYQNLELPPPAHRSGWKAAGGAAVGTAAVLLKFKSIIFIVLAKLKFIVIPLKYLKFGKVFTTMGSMIATVAIDAVRWGWAFAAGFVLLLFVHEMGHMLAIRAKGMKAGAPVFIPFVGAFIALKEMPHDAKSEAEIGIAGPVLGTLGAVGCLLLGVYAGQELFVRLAYIGFLINLFNLLPVLPLDGGRVMSAISPKAWLAGLVMSVALFIWSHNPLFIILVLLSVGRMWHGIKANPEEQDYYQVPRLTRIQMTLGYFGLASFLAIMMMHLHHPS